MLFSKEIGVLLEFQEGAEPPQPTPIYPEGGVHFYNLELHSSLSGVSGPANCLDVENSADRPDVLNGKNLRRLRLSQILAPEGSIAEELLSIIHKGIDGSTISTTYTGMEGENPRAKTEGYDVGSLYHWGMRLRGKKSLHQGPDVVYYTEPIKPGDLLRIAESMVVIADAVRNSINRKKVINF